MSDLEATGLRAQSAAPITAVAAGKLRAISGTQPLFASAEGMVDAFAEVFARMAESSARPIESTKKPDQSEDEPVVADEPAPQDNADPRPEPQREPIPDQAVPEVRRRDNEVQQADWVDHAVGIESVSVAQGHGDVEVDDQLQVSQEVVVADVEAEPTDSASNEIETPDFVTPEADQTDSREQSRRDRRDSTSTRPIENPASGHQKRDRWSTVDDDRQVGDQTGLDQEPLETQTIEQDQAEPTRRTRGGARYTRQSTENHLPPVSQNHPRPTQQHTQQAIGPPPSSDSVAAPSGQPDAAPSRTTASTIESQIHNAQAAQSATNRSGQPVRVQSGPRSFAQAIQSTAASRNTQSTKPDSPRAETGTQETVSRIKLIQRVSKAFQHLGPEGGVVRLRLAPAEMGSVRVEMRIHQRKVQARVVAETEAASKALREHLPDLRGRLESFGMQVEKIDIETDSHDLGQPSHFSDQSQGRDRQSGRGNDGQRFDRPKAEVSQSVSPVVSRSTPVGPPHAVSSGVDVRL